MSSIQNVEFLILNKYNHLSIIFKKLEVAAFGEKNLRFNFKITSNGNENQKEIS